jgi:hypothetical protein
MLELDLDPCRDGLLVHDRVRVEVARARLGPAGDGQVVDRGVARSGDPGAYLLAVGWVVIR